MRISPGPLLRRLRGALCHEIWNIGIVAQTAADIVRHGITVPVRWWPERKRHEMLADPAWMEGQGGCAVLAEFLDYRVGRGALWRAEVAQGSDPLLAEFVPWITEPFHLSYPVAFTGSDGLPRLAAEGWQSGGVPLWRLGPDGPVADGSWLCGRRPVDPTLVHHEGNWFLFCTFQDQGPDSRLFVFHAPSLDGHWTALPGNPVRVGRDGSRPAGPLFLAEGSLIRPGQDCTQTYGGAVILHKVTRLDPLGYCEEALRRLAPPAGRYRAGMHTFCPAGANTLIDAKRWQAAPLKPLRRMLSGSQAG